MAAFIEGPVAFSTSAYLMYTTTNDGSGITQVFSNQHMRDLHSVYVLPDGTKAVFAAKAANGYSQIYYLSPVDGTTEPLQLTTTPVDKTSAILSADGSKIVFSQLVAVNDYGAIYEAATMDANGANLYVLPRPSDWSVSHPFFAPDGKTIAVAMDQGWFGDMAVFIMNIDGTNLKRVTPGGTGGMLALTPAFSPDGSKIVFSTVNSGDVSLYVINSDGTGLKRIGQQNSRWGDPLFVGDRIMFIQNNQLHTVKSDGTDWKQVTSSLTNVFERKPYE